MEKSNGKSLLKDYREDSFIMSCIEVCRGCMQKPDYCVTDCKSCTWGKNLRSHCREYSLTIPYEIAIKKKNDSVPLGNIKPKKLKPYIVKSPVSMMPKKNMSDVQLTANDLDFIVKAKAVCDMNQNDYTCSPGSDCINCKWCAGVQMLDEFDPLARARLIDAADQKRWDVEDKVKSERKHKKKKRVSLSISITILVLMFLSVGLVMVTDGYSFILFGVAIVLGFFNLIYSYEGGK